MDLRKNIRHVLNEEMDNRKIFLNQMNKFGLLNLLKMSGIPYDKLFSLGIGPEHLTRKIKQEFIQDVAQSLRGIYLIEHDIEPIFYNENETEYREITYLGLIKVSVTVWYKVTHDISGEFGVLYYNLNDNIIDNKVKQNSIKEIGTTITSYFPFKFLFYLHSE